MMLQEVKRGCFKIVEEGELEDRLKKGKLRVKFGIDPTSSMLHLGHLVLFLKARDFQKLGHKIILIIGDFTAMVGDPSGRTALRPALTREEVEKNAKAILSNIFRFIDREKCEVLRNSEWFSRMSLSEFFPLLSKVTVSRIISREEFKVRLSEGKPLFAHEFLYPVLQGYDSVVTKADVEIGGHDQLFNLIFARDIMRLYSLKPQVCLTVPLLEGTDGKLKMSKTYGNYIGLDETPEDVFGKLMGIPDTLISKYFVLVGGMQDEEAGKLEEDLEAGRIHPFKAKQELAFKITSILHGEDEAKYAEEWFNRVIRERKLPDELPSTEIDVENGWLPKVLKEAGLTKSTSEALRLITHGGVFVDGLRITDKDFKLSPGTHHVRVGKTRFMRVILSSGSHS